MAQCSAAAAAAVLPLLLLLQLLGGCRAAGAARSQRVRLIGAGLPSTGTQSFVEALRKLGFTSSHGTDAFLNMTIRNAWNSYLHEGSGSLEASIETLLGKGFDATNDAPFFFAWKDLAELYPEAKVVLTVRDSAERWHESFATKSHHPPAPLYMTMQFVSWYWGADLDSYWGFKERNQALYGCNFDVAQTPELRETCIRGYTAHIEEVKRTIPPDRLLVYNVKQGWEPLCRFLGVPVPIVPFPKRDMTKESSLSLGDFVRQSWNGDVTEAVWMVMFPSLLLWGTLLCGVGLLFCMCALCCCRILCRRKAASKPHAE